MSPSEIYSAFYSIIRPMGQSEFKPGLIRSRRGALVVACLTGFVTALSFRDVLSHSRHQSHWLMDFYFFPAWGVVTVNLMFYAYLFWLGIAFYRSAQGRERFLVGGWFLGILLFPVRLVSISAGPVVDHVQLMGMVVAFLAAVDILLKTYGGNNPYLHGSAPRNT